MIRAAAHFPEIEAVVTDSAYASLEDVLPHAVPCPVLIPFVRWFAERETGISLAQMQPVDEIANISPRPVFIIHGEEDDVVTPGAGRRLFDAAREPRFLWIEPGVGHVEMQTTYPDEYEQRVIGFLETYLLEP